MHKVFVEEEKISTLWDVLRRIWSGGPPMHIKNHWIRVSSDDPAIDGITVPVHSYDEAIRTKQQIEKDLKELSTEEFQDKYGMP